MNQPRKLSRKNKDLVALLQLGRCGYCRAPLLEGTFECDHVNERRWDDRPCNLIAACRNCHGVKTRAARMCQHATLRDMLRKARSTRRECEAGWLGGQHNFGDAPAWLRARLNRGALPHCVLARLRAQVVKRRNPRRAARCKY